jgi:hypothetical protein
MILIFQENCSRILMKFAKKGEAENLEHLMAN